MPADRSRTNHNNHRGARLAACAVVVASVAAVAACSANGAVSSTPTSAGAGAATSGAVSTGAASPTQAATSDGSPTGAPATASPASACVTQVYGELTLAHWERVIDVNLRGVLHGIAAALPVFRQQGRGHLVTTVSTSGLKIVPTQAVYAGTKNAVRTLLEALRQESTDGVLRTTSISPGFVRTELVDYIDDPEQREQAQQAMATLGISPDAVARAIAFVIEQPDDVEIGDMTIRPARQA